jgi:hypothetical protein
MADKLTKIQVRYEVPAKGMDHCRDCKHFIGPNRCKIVEGDIQPNGWCEKFEDNKMAKKHHKYTHSTVEHHDDGSHTITHHHEDGKSHKKYAAADHDSMMDGMMDHTSAPNPGEAEAAAGMPPAGGAPAGAPPMAPPVGA